MDFFKQAITHITEVAKIPSFSSYEERLHPYIHEVFSDISSAKQYDVLGNNIVYRVSGTGTATVALTAHLDKINHYGIEAPEKLPVEQTPEFIEGAMDDSVGVGILLAIAERSEHVSMPDLFFFFSEMEESKGLKDHPELLKKNGEGYTSGMGATSIAKSCMERALIPDEIITVDTTPLFKGEPGIALYSKHWELNELQPSDALIAKTSEVEKRFKSIFSEIKPDNNTNDYLHYGKIFNNSGEFTVPSVALEPSIFPYHQKGERVFCDDVANVIHILESYLKQKA